MAIQKAQYIYPVKTKGEARTVTEPEFQPNLFDEHKLYVNLDDIRDRSYLDDLYFVLGYDFNNKTFDQSYDYSKLIFSGHRGCGKSAELRRIHKELNKPDCYFSIFIDLEEEVEVGSFQYADFYALLMHKLIQQLRQHDVTRAVTTMKSLANRLFESKTIEDKSEAKAGLGWEWGDKDFIKLSFSGENTVSETVRREVKRNTLHIINELNAALVDVRAKIAEKGKGQDILFIIDGSEKIQHAVYDELFIRNGNIIAEISVNMLMAVPISAYYEIEKAPYKFTNRYTVPMIKLGKPNNAMQKMKDIVGCRIDLATFIEDEALTQCVEYSGGCIRQLFWIVNKALTKSLGSKITTEHVGRAVKDLGQYLYEYLTTEHMDTLAKPPYKPGDKNVSELMQVLILLKYNGVTEINPILKAYPDFTTWQEQQPIA